jgi:hypothetical protein
MSDKQAEKPPSPFEKFVSQIARVPKSEADEVARTEKDQSDREKRPA